MDPDSALVDSARAGDSEAFRELFVRHRMQVTRIVFRMLGRRPEVEDVVQDVFLNVHRSLHSFRGDAKFSTWLHRLATNVTRMHLRRARSRPRFADVDVPEGPRDGQERNRPDQDLERNERVRALYRLLAKLSDKKREVLVLHDLEGMPAKDIAGVLEIPVLTVRTRLFYARKDLYGSFVDEPALGAIVEHLFEKLPGRPTKASGKQEGPKHQGSRSRKAGER